MHLRLGSRRNFLCAAGVGGAALLAACSPLTLINRLAPDGTYRPARDLAYGPEPRHRLDIYQPEAAGTGAPVVVFFYGGNWNSGDRADYLFAGEALASRGYVGIVPDYRLYPQVRFPDFLFDCAQAVRWVLDNCASWGGDPRRIFLMGHSAGAYNAAMLALNPHYLQSVGVATKQISGLVGLAGPYDFLPLIGNVTKAVFGFPDTPAYTQPINFAAAGAPPALLATGAADDIVDPGNSRRLAVRLRASGVAVREIVYPKLGHRTLLGALAAPLRGLGPVLADVSAFVDACTADCRV